MFFFPQAGCYVDYFAISFSKSEDYSLKRRIIGTLYSAGLDSLQIGKDIIFSSHEALEKINKGEAIVSGVSFESKCDPQMIPELACGNYTSLSYDKKSKVIKVTSDFFGLGVFYIYKGVGFSFVTNRLHLAFAILRTDYANRIDQSFIKDLITLASPQFLQQPITNRTAIKGLERASLGSAYEISNGCVSNKNLWSKDAFFEILKEKSYDNLIESAGEEIKSNIMATISQFSGKKLVCDLSGGKDSRMVLAALLSTCPKEKFVINTKQVPGSFDLLVACQIAEKYSLNFFDQSECNVGYVNNNDVIDAWRSYFFGEYHRVGFPTYTYEGQSPYVFLSGGVGETTTCSAQVEWLRKLSLTNSDSAMALLRLAAEKYCKDEIALFGKPDLNSFRLESDLSQETEFQGSTHDVLNFFYSSYRNRVHFGLNYLNSYHEGLKTYPLMSKFLFFASLSLTPLERVAGKPIYDLISYFDKDLASMPYSSRFSYAHKLGVATAEDVKELKASLAGQSINEWEDAQRRKSINLNKSLEYKVRDRKDPRDLLLKKTIASVIRIFDEDAKLTEKQKKSMIRKTETLFHNDPGKFLYFASQVISAADFYRSGDLLHISDEEVIKKTRSLNTFYFTHPIENIEVSRAENGEVSICVIRAPGVKENCLYAFYLYEDEKLVERVWYTKNSKQPFKVNDERSCAVLCFIKIGDRVFKKMKKI